MTRVDQLNSAEPRSGRPAVRAPTQTVFPRHTPGSTRTPNGLVPGHRAASDAPTVGTGGAATQPSATRRMRSQRAFGLNLSWARLTSVFLIDVAVLTLFGHAPWELRISANTIQIAADPWWVGVVTATIATIAALVTYRAVPLASTLTGRIVDRIVNPAAVLARGRTDAVDHRRRYGGESVGIREYRGRLAAVIAVANPAREHRQPKPSLGLPVPLVAAGLRQFDVHLDGIDIVSVTTCDRDTAAEAPAPQPGNATTPQRATWLVLRMDPQHNVEAIAARDSVASTFAAAAERLARDLDEHHVSARVATAEEFADVDAAILAGLQPQRVRLRRRRLKQRRPKKFSSTFWVSPRDITSPNLDLLCRPHIDATVMTVRLTRRHHRTQVSVLVRYHSSGRLRRKIRAGLNRLTGRQLTAVHSSLPTPVRHPELTLPTRELASDDQLVVPLDPTQQHRPQHQRVRIGGKRSAQRGIQPPQVAVDVADRRLGGMHGDRDRVADPMHTVGEPHRR